MKGAPNLHPHIISIKYHIICSHVDEEIIKLVNPYLNCSYDFSHDFKTDVRTVKIKIFLDISNHTYIRKIHTLKNKILEILKKHTAKISKDKLIMNSLQNLFASSQLLSKKFNGKRLPFSPTVELLRV